MKFLILITKKLSITYCYTENLKIRTHIFLLKELVFV